MGKKYFTWTWKSGRSYPKVQLSMKGTYMCNTYGRGVQVLPINIWILSDHNLEIIFLSPTNMKVMVLILDGNSGYNVQAWKYKIRFMTVLDFIKWLKQIK